MDRLQPGLLHALRLTLLCSLLVSLATVVKLYLSSRRPKHFPPGPPPLPIIGNLRELPPSKAFLKFHEWRKQYGDIIGLKFGPQNVVVLNNHHHVKELFDKRGAIYSSRPESYVGNELVCPGNVHVLLIPYSAAWRKLRSCYQRLLTVSSVDSLLPLQTAEATKTVNDIVNDPEGYYEHLRRFPSGVMMASTYGKRGKSFADKDIQDLYAMLHDFTTILAPGVMPPADEFPILKYVPDWMAGWKRRARAVGRGQMELYRKLLEESRRRLEKGELRDCFVKTALREQKEGKSDLNEAQMAYIGGIFIEAGSDTTAHTLLSFCLAMVTHPDVLRKCQEEVDACCTDHTPTTEEVQDFPYLRACLTETLRWRPVAPAGFPHVLTEDNVYGEYMIPKGTMLFANTWAIHRDESEYASPAEFIPERFLDNKFGSKLKAEDGDIGDDKRRITYAFGAGRRVCAGQRLAENSLMIITAKIVWAFDIKASAPVDASIESGYTDGFVLGPKKFPADFVPRTQERASIVAKEAEEAERFLSRFESADSG